MVSCQQPTTAKTSAGDLLMGFRFYRRLNILPGLSLNLSGSGLSASFGPRGAKMTVGPRGVFGSLGLPGTGLSYRQKLNAPNGRATQPKPPQQQLDPSKLTPEALELMQAVVDGKDGVTKSLNSSEEVLTYWEKIKCLPGAHMIHPETGRRMSETQVRAFARKLDREANIKRLTQEIAEEEARLRDAVRYWHPLPSIPDWQSYADEYEDLVNAPFPETEPAPAEAPDETRAYSDLLAAERATLDKSWLMRLMPKRAARKAEYSAKERWAAHWAVLESRHEVAVRQHEEAMRAFREREADWRARCEQETAELYALMSGQDQDVLMEVACEAVNDLALPFQADARVMLDDDVSVFVDIDLPEIENVVPPVMRQVSKTGSIKSSKRAGDDLHEPYAELVFGHCLNVVAKLFIELPRLQTATLAAYTRRDGKDDYVLEASVTRDAMTEISSASPSSRADLISALARSTATYELDEDSMLKTIKEPDWAKQHEIT